MQSKKIEQVLLQAEAAILRLKGQILLICNLRTLWGAMLETSLKLLCKSAKTFGGLSHIFGICSEFTNLAVIMNLAFDPAP